MDIVKSNSNIHVLRLALLLLALVFCISPSLVSGFAEIYAKKTHVHVMNELAPGTQMTLHCKSKDDDLGPHVLNYGESYTWDFTVNFWQTTLFWCYMNYYDGTKLVETSRTIYKVKRDYKNCGFHCFWSIRKDGLYEKTGDSFEFIFPWQD